MMVTVAVNGLCKKGHILRKIGCVLQIGGMGLQCLDMLDVTNLHVNDVCQKSSAYLDSKIPYISFHYFFRTSHFSLRKRSYNRID